MDQTNAYRAVVRQAARDVEAVLSRRAAKKAGGGRNAEARARQHLAAMAARLAAEEQKS